jgi:hypothetical protein
VIWWALLAHELVCLPLVGVGGELQEAAGNSCLSSVLKEKFGGLKKFLETQSDVFVLGKLPYFVVFARDALCVARLGYCCFR